MCSECRGIVGCLAGCPNAADIPDMECEGCGGGMYEGDDFYLHPISGEQLCEECWDNYTDLVVRREVQGRL